MKLSTGAFRNSPRYRLSSRGQVSRAYPVMALIFSAASETIFISPVVTTARVSAAAQRLARRLRTMPVENPQQRFRIVSHRRLPGGCRRAPYSTLPPSSRSDHVSRASAWIGKTVEIGCRKPAASRFDATVFKWSLRVQNLLPNF